VDDREKNKAIVRRFVKEIFEELKPEAVDQLVTDDFTWHRPGGAGDREFLRTATSRMAGALTNLRFAIDDELAEGDRVAVRLTASATAAADFPGIVGSAGRRYSIEEIHVFRLREGRVAEHWHQYDATGQQAQLRGDGDTKS
jgi:predicted ester cyclase